MAWSESFTKGWTADTDTKGAGTPKQFLSRHAYGVAGGVAAEVVHDWAIEEHGKGKKGLLAVVEDMAEETVVVLVILVAAYAVEELWQNPRAKIFTAGMAGRYGSEAWDWLKERIPGFGGKDKDKDDSDEDEDEDEEKPKKAQGLSLDGDPRMIRRMGGALANSPQTVDELAGVLSRTLDKQGAWTDPDPAARRAKLAAAMTKLGEQLKSA